MKYLAIVLFISYLVADFIIHSKNNKRQEENK